VGDRPEHPRPHAIGHVGHRGRRSRLHLFEIQCRNTVEQPRSGAKCERHDVQPQLVEQARGEILVDGGRAALDRNFAVPGRFARVFQCGFDSVGDEVERGATLHRLWIARVVSEHEGRDVERRIIAPPAVPVAIPLAAHRAEHVAAHDERAGRRHPVDLGPVLLRGFEHPGVQLAAPAVATVVAERALFGLVVPGRVPVGRDRQVAGHLARACGHLFCPPREAGAFARIDRTGRQNSSPGAGGRGRAAERGSRAGRHLPMEPSTKVRT
jgi:hypothetical protein